MRAWLTSRRNAAGSVCGIAGLALGVTGVVPAPWWPLGVAALYAAGALAVPRGAAAATDGLTGTDEDSYDDRVDVERLRAALDERRHALIGRVPTDVIRAVDRVAAALEELFERPDLLRRGSPEAFVIERMVDDYLPTALDAYLSLPRAFAGHHQLPDGRTPRQVLLDQLALLEKVARESADAASWEEADRLLAHDRFLADRFGPHALDLDLPAPGRSDTAPASAPPAESPSAPEFPPAQ